MNEDLTHVYVLTDRSSSMWAIIEEVISGFNQFLKEQQDEEEGECLMSYAQFDDQYEEVFRGQPIHNVKPLTEETFVPRGSTALLDAWGRSMISLKAHIDSLPEDEKPGSVAFVVITDGQENCSREMTRRQVFDMVTARRDDGWNFTFIAANQDAVAEATKYGIERTAALSFATSSAGVGKTYTAVSKGVIGLRKKDIKSFSYSDVERSEAMEEDEKN